MKLSGIIFIYRPIKFFIQKNMLLKLHCFFEFKLIVVYKI